MKKQQFCLS